ncbi:hypothetical protein VP1G_11277 [Cytospora mali]|uniref:Uncharacterized protein n=1 Tax=Cytospora mali TaxID=578113 RepID=A0A194VAX7_CYTMA|nr:hypothetical protein VP1G_11277 [Valsa mali var. pyri (nom. inval.)]
MLSAGGSQSGLLVWDKPHGSRYPKNSKSYRRRTTADPLSYIITGSALGRTVGSSADRAATSFLHGTKPEDPPPNLSRVLILVAFQIFELQQRLGRWLRLKIVGILTTNFL